MRKIVVELCEKQFVLDACLQYFTARDFQCSLSPSLFKWGNITDCVTHSINRNTNKILYRLTEGWASGIILCLGDRLWHRHPYTIIRSSVQFVRRQLEFGRFFPSSSDISLPFFNAKWQWMREYYTVRCYSIDICYLFILISFWEWWRWGELIKIDRIWSVCCVYYDVSR